MFVAKSLAIVEYLEGRFPEKKPRLLPENPDDRAAVRSLSYQIASNIQPLQSNRVLLHLKNLLRNNMDKPEEFAVYWMERGLAELEELLSKTAGKFAYGDEISLADICISPQVFNGTRIFHIDMDRFPIIKRINETLSKLPEVQKAHPAQQIEAPGDIS
ncbi:putative maleylacetoacetate isomerase 2 [Ditylenchus destructor]|nr:putative maleylacetoacetate isomerase 2 [Ditylenchus destructor]